MNQIHFGAKPKHGAEIRSGTGVAKFPLLQIEAVGAVENQISAAGALVCAALTRHSLLEAGDGHFFTGSYIDQSLASVGGSQDADWVDLQTTIKF